MQAPDTRPPWPLRYLMVRASVIPLEPHEKRPYLDILEGHTWAPYQSRRPSEIEVQGWLQQGHDHNWGVVCGQVSDGLYCGDVDDPDFAVWVLDHARDPLLRGACVVRSGSGKAHIWFRSPNKLLSGRWKLARGKAVGDIRGDGNGDRGPSYMVVPPSIHPDTGKPYTFVAHSFSDLPSIDNGDAFLADVLRAYLNDDPFVAPPQVSSNGQEILRLDDADTARVLSFIDSLNLKGKMRDTLLRPGNQNPGTRHWQNVGSRSEIDYAVCCDLIRRGLVFDQIEQIFAASLIGANRYRETKESHHGYSYLKLTYDNAKRDIDAQKQASRVARGSNFEVVEVLCERFDKNTSRFYLTADCQYPDGSIKREQVMIWDRDLLKQEKVREAFATQTPFVPGFNANQRGNNFPETFAQAVKLMISETRQAPEAATRLGPTVQRLREFMRRLPRERPSDEAVMDRLGWREGEQCFLVANEITRMLRADDHALKNEDVLTILEALGGFHKVTHRWPSGVPIEMVVVTLRA